MDKHLYINYRKAISFSSLSDFVIKLKQPAFLKPTVSLVLNLTLLLILPFRAAADEEYSFERMWPTLQQPWYFSQSNGIAVDDNGFVYALDTFNNRIMKFTSNGDFVTKWGDEGSEEGEFDRPNGIAIDNSGYVYVADTNNNRIQKFTANGQFMIEWGAEGAADGRFKRPQSVTVDNDGYVYVVENGNYRIQKFTTEGTFVTKWGRQGSGDGEFNTPYDVAVDASGYVYVADCFNKYIQKFTAAGQFVKKWVPPGIGDWFRLGVDKDGFVFVADTRGSRIQKFASDGQFVMEWGSRGYGDGEFSHPADVAIDKNGVVHVIESSLGTIYSADVNGNSIQKFTADGVFISRWSSSGTGDGEFTSPSGLAIDINGYVYVADTFNHRVQKFTSDGQFVTKWGQGGGGAEDFGNPIDIDVDHNNFVYVTDGGYNCIKKFTADGQFVAEFGRGGTGDGEFRFLAWGMGGIAIDDTGYLYVADYSNNRIQKLNSNGDFILKWGGGGSGFEGSGDGDGEFSSPRAVAVDSDDYLYVVDSGNHRIQKFTSNGGFVTKWGTEGSGEGEFYFPMGIDVDKDSFVYVADVRGIQKFTSDGQFLTRIGGKGSEPGMFSFLFGGSLAIDSNGTLFVCDNANNRIQVLKKVTQTSNNKAIVVAGGGAYQGNHLWDATQMCTNFAYRTLTYQGFTKDSIYYLSSDTDLDLDNNSVLDDVDGDVTKTNLQNAISTWASGADDVVIYLNDHGGDDTFRMSDTETLSASDLDSWLDSMQQTITGKAVVIYDACESGSFLLNLAAPSGKERIIISSTSPNESAYFVSQGSISFSNYFWTHVFNGLSVYDAFDLADDAISQYQTPLLDDSGNGIGNETGDGTLAQNTYIGNGTVIQGEVPVIGGVSSPQTINNTSSASLYAEDVTDDDGIARAWAIITPPDYTQSSPDNPIQELPSLDLMPAGSDRYEGNYDEFTIAGTYQIAIYARDRIGNTSLPKLSTVSVNNPLSQKAIIVAGGPQSDSLWPAIESNAVLSYEALTYQGYSDDDIYFMSPITISAGVDGLPTISNLSYAITTWASQNTQDVVLYLIGNGDNGTFTVSETETLTASTLGGWLNTLQNTISGKVTLIYDGCRAESFLSSLIPPTGKERILICSTGTDKPAYFLSEGDICFSKYFWSQVLNGADVREAFIHAKQAISFSCQEQTPSLDDNGNGIGNERDDGQLARSYTIGVGIILAGDEPIIGSICPEQTLSGQSSATIWVGNVTTTGTIEKVWAVITPPNYSIGLPSDPVTDLPTLELNQTGNNRYEGTYSSFTITGTYEIAVYAIDGDNNISLPKETSVTVSPPLLNVSSIATDLTASPITGQPLQITFTANGQESSLSYKYLSRSGYQTQSPGSWQLLQDWSVNNTLTWTPTTESHYILIAYATDDTTGSSFHQAGLSVETSGNSANPIQITDLTTDMDYPQSSGASITITTTATGGNGPLNYRYYYRKGTTGQWTEIKGYSTENSCSWTPPDDGLYVVVVHVTDDPSGNTFSIAGMTCTIGE